MAKARIRNERQSVNLEETVMKAASTLILLLCAAGLAACGSSSAPAGAGGVAGTYEFDVDRTAAQGGERVDAAAAEALREQLGPDAYRVDLRPDGSFALDVSVGEDSLHVDGRWGQGPDGNWIETETVNGTAPDAKTPVTGTFEVEADGIVLSEGDQRIYLRRRR